MQVINLPDDTVYRNLYTLSGYDAGRSLIVTNNTADPAFLAQSATIPALDSFHYPLNPGQTTLVQGNQDPIWILGGSGPIFVQSVTETITAFQHMDLPKDAYTSVNEGFRRLQVDVAQTGLTEGREFRTFYRLNIPTGNTVYLRFTSAVDFVIYGEQIVLADGWIDSTAYRIVDNVAGTWTDRPTIARNITTDRPTPFYVSQAKLQVGGTYTFLAADEVGPPIIVRAASATAQTSSIPAGNSRERYLLAGTYYLKMTAMGTGTAVGCYYLDWEELPTL